MKLRNTNTCRPGIGVKTMRLNGKFGERENFLRMTPRADDRQRTTDDSRFVEGDYRPLITWNDR